MEDETLHRIYEDISKTGTLQLHSEGYSISNAFIVRQDEKRRSVMNLSSQSDLIRDEPVTM